MAESKPKGSAVESTDAQELRAELERLRAENELLSQGGGGTRFWRNLMGGLAICLGVVMLAVAISAVWLNRTVMDEDRWVDTMAPLAREASIQDYVATKASDSLFSAVDIKGYVEFVLGGFETGQVEFVKPSAPLAFLHKGRCAEVRIGPESAGYLGELSYLKVQELELKGPVYVAELSLETPLEDLGLDSLDKQCLFFEIEDLFNVAIPDATASQMKCDADILAYVASSQRGPSH